MITTDERDSIENTLRFLCGASRVTGSDWNRTVCDNVLKEFTGFGYETEVEESMFTGWELIDQPRLRYLKPSRQPIGECLPVVWAGSTEGVVSGTIRTNFPGVPSVLTTFGAYQWRTLPVVDAGGSLKACLLAGPVTWPQPRDDEKDETPYIMLSTADLEFVLNSLRRGLELKVQLSVSSRYTTGKSLRNIIARSSPGPSIILSAHYDSFFNTTGFHDNASGLAALLTLARRLARNPDPVIAFVAFDAEEWNRLGSCRFVAKRRNHEEISDIRAVLNIDSVAVGDSIYVAAATPLISPATEAARNAETLVPFSIQPLNVTDPFDTWPFMSNGIPAVQIGAQGRSPFPYWHHPNDNIGLFSAQTFNLIDGVLALAGRLISRGTLDFNGGKTASDGR